MKGTFVSLFFLLASWGANATDSCSTALSTSVEERLQGLPPLQMDLKDPRGYIKRLSADVAALSPYYQALNESIEAFSESRVTKEEFGQSIESILSSVKSYATQILDQVSNGGTITERARHRLEAVKLLLNNGRQIQNITAEQAQALAQKEKERQEELKQEALRREEEQRKEEAAKERERTQKERAKKNQGEKNKQDQRKKELGEKSENSPVDESEQNTNENTTEDATADKDKSEESDSVEGSGDITQEEGDREGADKDQQTESRQNQKLNKKEKPTGSKNQQNKNAKKSDQNKSREQGSEEDEGENTQEADESQEAEQEAGEEEQSDSGDSSSESSSQQESKKESSRSEKGQPKKGQPKKGQVNKSFSKGEESGEGQPGEGQGQGEQGGEGGPSEGQKSEGGKPGKGKPGKQAGEGKSGRGEATGEEGDGNPSEDGEMQESQSQSEGSQSFGKSQTGDQGFGSQLADKFKSLFEQWMKDNPIEEDLHEGESNQNGNRDNKTNDKKNVSKNKTQDRPWTPKKENTRPSYDESKKLSEAKFKPLSITDEKREELLKFIVENSFAKILRRYQSSESLLNSLGNFKTYLNNLSATIRKSEYLGQMALKTESIRETLSQTRVDYASLEALGLSFIGSSSNVKEGLLRKLNYLDLIFSELNNYGGLTADEGPVHSMVQQLLASLEGGEPGDRELAKTFYAQLPGPISRRFVSVNYRLEGDPDGLNVSSLAKDIRDGKLTDLLVFNKLSPYLSFLLNRLMKPKNEKSPMGEKVPISENDPELDRAQELDRLQHFYNEGLPLELDLLRFVSGDVLESVYRDNITRDNPKALQPKKVSILIYDVSGSMQGHNDTIRNALLAAYLDRSQIDVATKKGEHVLYTVGFDLHAHTAEKINNFAQAIEHFDRIRKFPPSSGSDTSITNALVNAYETIAKHQHTTKELNRANIFLITDGEDQINFERIREARKLVSSDVDVRLNAITLGKYKEDIKRLVDEASEISKDKMSYQYIPSEEVANIINATTRIRSLTAAAKNFVVVRSPVDNPTFIPLKNKLTSLQARQGSQDDLLMAQGRRWISKLKSTILQHQKNADLEKAMETFRLLPSSGVTDNWSRAEKLNTFLEFLEQLGLSTSTPPEIFIDQMSVESRQSILKWIEK